MVLFVKTSLGYLQLTKPRHLNLSIVCLYTMLLNQLDFHIRECSAGIVLAMYTAISYYYSVPRLQLAALHFNENSNRKQTVTKKGEEQYEIIFPKFKRGGYTVRKVLEDPTFGNFYD